MISDWVAGAAAVLLQGPLLFLLALVACGFAFGAGYRRGRQDQARWAVADRMGAEAVRSKVPGQREPS